MFLLLTSRVTRLDTACQQKKHARVIFAAVSKDYTWTGVSWGDDEMWSSILQMSRLPGGRSMSVGRRSGVGPVRYMTISVHGADHFGTTTSVHIGVQLRYTERTLYLPFRYIHFGSFSNAGLNNDLHGRYKQRQSRVSYVRMMVWRVTLTTEIHWLN